MDNLKNDINKIEMPEEMKDRIFRNCLTELSQETEDPSMKRRKSMKRTFLIAAVLVLCLPVIGMAVKTNGTFKDVKNIFGTVTGTEYENATEEISLSLSAEKDMLCVEAVFTVPDAFPYKTSEQLSIGTYQILNEKNLVVLEGEGSPSVAVTEGHAVFYFPLDALEKGNYTLIIDSFISSKKGDQPLPVYGSWSIDFTL